MRVLKTVQELDEAMHEVGAGAFRMEHAESEADPHSEKYRSAVIAHHSALADTELLPRTEAAGHHPDTLAYALKCTPFPPGSRLLVFGSGVMATALAQAGFLVTAVVADSQASDALKTQARGTFEVVHDDFSRLERLDDPVDGVMFFGALGSAIDHPEIFGALDEALQPGGRVMFAGEPIFPNFPVAWGVRLDGASLRSARQQGVLELGFREAYLREALARAGWAVRRHEQGKLRCWEASRRRAWSWRFAGSAPELHSQLGIKTKSTIRVSAEKRGVALFGPYAQTPAGRWTASLEVRGLNGAAPSGLCTLDVASLGHVHAMRELQLSALPEGPIELSFDLPSKLPVEVRLITNGPVALEIVELHIYPTV